MKKITLIVCFVIGVLVAAVLVEAVVINDLLDEAVHVTIDEGKVECTYWDLDGPYVLKKEVEAETGILWGYEVIYCG